MLSDSDLLRLKLLADSHRDHEPVTVTAGELRELLRIPDRKQDDERFVRFLNRKKAGVA
jgi:hypothetical protein